MCPHVSHSDIAVSPQKDIDVPQINLYSSQKSLILCQDAWSSSGIRTVSNGEKKSSVTSTVREIIQKVNYYISRDGWEKKNPSSLLLNLPFLILKLYYAEIYMREKKGWRGYLFEHLIKPHFIPFLILCR